jgi:hypothetical protein
VARYVEPKRRSRENLEHAFATANGADLCQPLIDMAYFESEASWALCELEKDARTTTRAKYALEDIETFRRT